MSVVSANGSAAPLSPNVIINGAFDFWQRGTSFGPSTSGGLLADRWKFGWDGNASCSVSQQSFPLGGSPDPLFEATYFQRFTVGSVGTTTFVDLYTSIEDVRTFSNQTVTFSFWAKADSNRTVATAPFQGFGSGGSGWFAAPSKSVTLSTSWARYTHTFVMPTISGKTIGPGSSVNIGLRFAPGSGMVIDLWGIQLEAGSVATPFRRNAPSLQAELAACQRYYEKSYNVSTNPGTASDLGNGVGTAYGSLAGSTAGNIGVAGNIPFKVTKRATPTIVAYDYDGTANAVRVYPADSKKIGLTSFANIRESGAYQFISFNNTSGVAINSGNYIMFHWTAEAEL